MTPPRLTVLLASEAPVGVVLRRGPSKLVRIVMWDRTKDKFKGGPWFSGRILADQSDISPDGRRLIYFAMDGVASEIPETEGSWTAISQLPSLNPDALWRQGDTWGGGGMFLSNESFWLDEDKNTSLIHDNSGLNREIDLTNRPCPSRMERDGWVKKGRPRTGPLFEKALPDGWTLRRVGWNGGYELEHAGDRKLPFPTWDWADWDRKRIVWTEAGRLNTASLETHNLGTTRALYDFNGMLPPDKPAAK